MNKQEYANQVIEQATFRRNIYNMVPDGATKVLDFGCGDGALLLRLQRDKGCTELYGLEVEKKLTHHLGDFVEKVFHTNIEQDFSPLEPYEDFFNYIILHDVIEHLYDPWFTLMKIRSLLSPNGRILIATPNIHHWRLQYDIMSGFFPYGPGLWHTGHLRWYTPISLIELLVIGGLSINEVLLEIPDRVDLSYLETVPEMKHFQIPPKELRGNKDYPNTYTMSYEKDISAYAPVFYAHKLLADCSKGDLIVEPAPFTYDCPKLQGLRDMMDLPFDIYNPPPLTPLIGNWR